MKIALHQITTREGTFAEHMAAYSKTGWRHFEINLWHAGDDIEQMGLEATAKMVSDHGLTCIAATGLALAANEPSSVDQDVEKAKGYAEVMAALGCRPLVIGATSHSDANADNYDECLKAQADYIRIIAEAVTSFGVQLAIEVNWTGMCRSYRTAAKLVDYVAHPNVGLIWDPAHFVSTPSRVADLDLANGRIIHAHLNDIRDCYFEAMNINGDRVIPGQGILPLEEWTQKVQACGYDGFHAVELFNEALWAKPLETICRNVMDGCLSIWPDATF